MKPNGIYSTDEIEEIVRWRKQYNSLTPDRLLLGANNVPKKYRPTVALQLKVAQALEQKLPTWAAMGVYIPNSINLEQATSELCATYKQRYITDEDRLLDMTGGLGVDFYALAHRANYAVYTEQNEATYQAAKYNLALLLPPKRYTLRLTNSLAELSEILAAYHPSIIYIDPARREDGQSGRRVYAIEDCTPNLHDVLDTLSSVSAPPRLLVKLSPMLDIKHTLERLPYTRAIDILSVKGEVKELLLHIDLDKQTPIDQVLIQTVDLHPNRGNRHWQGTLSQESSSSYLIASTPKQYLYEPNGAVMKSGLFNLIGNDFSLEKLAPHTHLYTSDYVVEKFPGKIYEILEVIPFSSSLIKKIHRKIPQAMIATRNFPLSPELLRKRLRIADGGNTTIFGVSTNDDTLLLLHCHRI